MFLVKTGDCHFHLQSAANTAETTEVRNRALIAGRECALAYRELLMELSQVGKACVKQSVSEKCR